MSDSTDVPPSSKFDRTLYRRYALRNLVDSIFLFNAALEAEERCNSIAIGAYSRMSILASAAFFEGASNCLIESLRADKSLSDSIDRFNPVDKIALFVFHRIGASIDRGDLRLAKVKEIKRFRDAMVHPKAVRVNYFSPREHVRFMEPEKRYPNSNITQDPDNARAIDALRAIQSLNEFFTWIFSDLVRINKRQVRFLLNSESPSPGGANDLLTPFFPPDLIRKLEAFNVSLDFVEINH